MLRWVIIIGRDLMIGAETTDDQLEKCMQWSDREKRLLKYWTDGRAIEALAVLQKQNRRAGVISLLKIYGI